MGSQKKVVIVDAYTPTRRLAPLFAELGYEVVRVQSTSEPPTVYQTAFDVSPYADNIVHIGDLNATVDAVAAHEPVAVVAGGEIGVEMADQLSEALGLLTNGTAISAARRDKYLQMERVRSAGLRATRQILVQDADHVAQWHREMGGRIVVKPIRSAAGDGVSFCDSPAESVAAYRQVLGAENIFSTPNTAMVAQEYLRGGEYVVDTVSRDGQHHVTDIWKYEKISANGITDLTVGLRLLPRHGDVQDAIVPYAFDVLDALGILHGASHMELKLTPDGPCLVEDAARMAGLGYAFLLAAGHRRRPARMDCRRIRTPRAFCRALEGRLQTQATLRVGDDGLHGGRAAALLPIPATDREAREPLRHPADCLAWRSPTHHRR